MLEETRDATCTIANRSKLLYYIKIKIWLYLLKNYIWIYQNFTQKEKRKNKLSHMYCNKTTKNSANVIPKLSHK